MAIVTFMQAQEQLNFVVGPPEEAIDHGLILRKIDAAENLIDRMLGFRMVDAIAGERAGFEGGCPPALVEAILQLVAHLYEHRGEASAEALREPPFGVTEIVASFREWTF